MSAFYVSTKESNRFGFRVHHFWYKMSFRRIFTPKIGPYIREVAGGDNRGYSGIELIFGLDSVSFS